MVACGIKFGDEQNGHIIYFSNPFPSSVLLQSILQAIKEHFVCFCVAIVFLWSFRAGIDSRSTILADSSIIYLQSCAHILALSLFILNSKKLCLHMSSNMLSPSLNWSNMSVIGKYFSSRCWWRSGRLAFGREQEYSYSFGALDTFQIKRLFCGIGHKKAAQGADYQLMTRGQTGHSHHSSKASKMVGGPGLPFSFIEVVLCQPKHRTVDACHVNLQSNLVKA